MPSTPTITLTASDAAGTISIAVANPDSPNHNRIYRKASREYAGAFVRLTDSLGVDGTFVDYNVASGVVYSYYAEAVDGSNVAAASLTAGGSVSLGRVFLHQTTKSAAATNLTGSSLDLIVTPTVDRPLARGAAVFEMGGRTAPFVAPGLVTESSIQLRVLILASEVADRATLEAIFEGRGPICVRDLIGNKFFGAISDLEINYVGIHTEAQIRLDVSDYSEAV